MSTLPVHFRPQEWAKSLFVYNRRDKSVHRSENTNHHLNPYMPSLGRCAPALEKSKPKTKKTKQKVTGLCYFLLFYGSASLARLPRLHSFLPSKPLYISYGPFKMKGLQQWWLYSCLTTCGHAYVSCEAIIKALQKGKWLDRAFNRPFMSTLAIKPFLIPTQWGLHRKSWIYFLFPTIALRFNNCKLFPYFPLILLFLWRKYLN